LRLTSVAGVTFHSFERAAWALDRLAADSKIPKIAEPLPVIRTPLAPSFDNFPATVFNKGCAWKTADSKSFPLSAAAAPAEPRSPKART
jgi:hypothetical protein